MLATVVTRKVEVKGSMDSALRLAARCLKAKTCRVCCCMRSLEVRDVEDNLITLMKDVWVMALIVIVVCLVVFISEF